MPLIYENIWSMCHKISSLEKCYFKKSFSQFKVTIIAHSRAAVNVVWQGISHSHPQRPLSFWSAPRIILYSQPIRFFEHAQSDRKSVNGRLLVLDLLRGRNSQCWQKGMRPLGLSMGISILPQSCLHVGKESLESYLCPVLHLLVKCLATKLWTNMLHSSCCK